MKTIDAFPEQQPNAVGSQLDDLVLHLEWPQIAGEGRALFEHIRQAHRKKFAAIATA